MDSLKNSGSFNGLQQRQCLGERNAPYLQILSVTKIAMESSAESTLEIMLRNQIKKARKVR